MPPSRRPAFAVLFVSLLVIGLLLNLGVRPLSFEEPRRGLVALEMELRGDWVVPTTNGAPYLNKPPLFNWVLLAFMRLFGSTAEWVVRLPTVVSFLLTACLVHAVARRYLARQTALLAAALYLTFGQLLFKATLAGEIDLFFSLVVAAQALAIFHFEQSGQLLPLYVVSYLLAAAGVLTKGVPSVAFQGVTLLVWLAHARRLRTLLSWQHAAGLCAFALCAGGYFALYAQRAELAPFLANVLLESSERTAAGPGHGLASVLVHAARFPLELLWLLVPWTAFVPLLLAKGFRATLAESPLLKFCVLFTGANLVPYWLSPGTRQRYLYMFLPFAALLLAATLERARRDDWYPRLVEWALGACLAACTLAAAVVPFTRLGAFLSSPAAWFVVCGGLLALLVAYGRRPDARVMAALLAIASLRLGYDLVVPNLRRTTSGASYYREVASALNERYAHERIALVARTWETARDLPLVGGSVVVRQVEFFPSSLSFYFTAGRRQILELAPELVPGRLYLARSTFRVDRHHEVLETFRSTHEDTQELKLVKIAASPTTDPARRAAPAR